MLARIQSNRNGHSLLMIMKNGTATLEDSGSFFKAKHSLTILSSNHAPRYFQTNWKTSLDQNRYLNVYNSFIHNSPKLEATMISSLGKQINCGIPIQ